MMGVPVGQGASRWPGQLLARFAGGWHATIVLAIVVFGLVPLPARADPNCGNARDNPCRIAGGSYYASLPAAPPPAGGRPVVLFFHGAGGLGTTAIEPSSYLRPFVEAGYVVLGANGEMRPDNPFGTTWSFRPQGTQHRDERAFAEALLTDAARRFAIDRTRLLLTGFSIGGSLVWRIACEEPGFAAAYAPLAGGFWRPHPTNCAGPVDLFHSHGWRDRTVPLEGRPLRSGAIFQGDIFEGLALWRTVNGCKGIRPEAFETGPVFWIRTWNNCESGRELALAIHPGDHDAVPMEWAELARRWFEARLAARALTK